MQELSNLLRQRLGARPEPPNHPDPDTLTAYAEQALAPAERSQIMAHLADCAPCREVVALSLPPMAEAQVVLKVARPGFRTLGLRWAALAAMIVIVVTLGILQPWKVRQGIAGTEATARTEGAHGTIAPLQTSSASAPASPASSDNRPAAPAMADQAAQSAPPVAPAMASPSPAPHVAQSGLSEAKIQSVPAAKTAAPSMLASRQPPAPAVGGGVVTHSATHDYVDLRRFSSTGATGLAGPANQTVTVDVSNAVAGNTAESDLVAAPAPKGETRLKAADAFSPARATPPISLAAIGSTAAATTSDKPGAMVVPPPPSAGAGTKVRKFVAGIPGRISGAVDKKDTTPGTAFSSGNVRFQPNLSSNREMGAREQDQLQWSISSDGKLIKSEKGMQWHEAYPQDQDLQFRAVWTDSEGHEIWAGGSHLTLIHSWNGGVEWKKLRLDEAAGSGDITAISIDEGNVLVKTSNGQTFVSQDKGVTWVPLKSNQPAQPK